MNHSLSLFFQRVRSAFTASLTASSQLLAPNSAACSVCGKPHSQARSESSLNHKKLPTQLLQTVCGVCLSAIPWLTRIICPLCGRGIHCEDCIRATSRSFQYNRSAVYYNQTMKQWLAQYKYRGNEHLAPVLANMLLPAFEKMTQELSGQDSSSTRQCFRQPDLYSKCWDAITYVPISAERAEDRGFNQAEQLASHIAGRYRLPLLQLLIRDRHTEKQSFKTRSERMRDTKQLFKVNHNDFQKLQPSPIDSNSTKNSPHKGLRILLIDDIYTTGSTAESCAKTLSLHAEQPLEVYILTWARS